MAGDWVKIRVWLHRDPKLISMADFLAGEREFMNWLTDPVQQHCKDSVYEHVTRNVTCHVTRSALVTLWGVARERGYRDGDDLILPHCDLGVLDEVADLPCLGRAMEYVGWAAQELRQGDDVTCVRFPNFFEDQAPPSDRHNEKNAKRQREFRDRQRQNPGDQPRESNVTRNVTRNAEVTHREEKSREEKEEYRTPLPPKGGESSPIPPESNQPPKPPRPKPTEWDGELPVELASPAFHELWLRWERHRRGKRSALTSDCRAAQLRKLAAMGLERATAAVAFSLEQGYTGIFEPKSEAAASNGRPAPQDRDAARLAKIKAMHEKAGIPTS